MAESIPGKADFQTKFLFRLHLLKLAQQLDFDSKNLGNAKFLLKKYFTREEELRIQGAMELFVALEQAGKISINDMTVLKEIMDVCGVEYEPFVKYAVSTDSSRRRCEFDANLDDACMPESREDNKMYKACLISVSNKLATADGSLQKLIYLCPELDLSDTCRLRSGCDLFAALEAQNLISSSHLSYLYCRFNCLLRKDLAEEIGTYIRRVRDRSPLLRMHSDPGVYERSDRSHEFRNQSSFPESFSDRKNSQPGRPLPRNDTSLPLLSRDAVPDASSKSLPPLNQPEMPVANGISSTVHQEGCMACRNRSSKVTKSPPPTLSRRNDSKKAIAHEEPDSESQQDDSDAETHNGQHKMFFKHVYSLPAAFFELFQLVLCIIFRRPGEVSDQAITIFNHPVYRMMYCLQQKTLKTMLIVVLAMVVLANLYKFLLEEHSCGWHNAVLNLISRLLTHSALPAYYLNHLWGIDNSALENLRFLAEVAKRNSPRYSRILRKVVNDLSTPSEIAELEDRTVIEQVNILLDTKLSVVCRTSLLLSVMFFLQILFLRASNFESFEASPPSLSLVCVVVITVASFVVHCTSGVICCLYLFEMRVREYCAHILRVVRKSRNCDSELRQDVRAVRSTLKQRWKHFRWVVLCSSIIYLIILSVSIASGTPFHCHGERTKFADSEINQIRAAWAFNIIFGLFCHCLVYSYFNFLTGRRLAVCLQVIFFFISLGDPYGPKWAIVIQISNVIYPAASSLSLHILACHAIFNQEGGSNRNMSLFWIFFAKLRSSLAFVTHFVLLVVHVVAIIVAIHHEYESFAPQSSK